MHLTQKTPSHKPRLFELVLIGIATAKDFINDVLDSPLKVVAASVNNEQDTPIVHLVIDGTDIDQDVLETHGATPIDAAYTKPGYTAATWTAADEKTGLYLVASDESAATNPNFGPFADMLRDATYGKGFKVVDADGEIDEAINVLIGIGSGTDRTLFGKTDGQWVRINQLRRGDIDFAVQGGVLAYAAIGQRKVVGTTFQELRDVVAGEAQSPNWRQIGQLPGNMAYFGRGSSTGFVVNMTGKHGIDYVAAELRVEDKSRDIEFRLKGEVAASTSDNRQDKILIGPTAKATGDDQVGQPLFATLEIDADGMGDHRKGSLHFLLTDGLSASMRQVAQQAYGQTGASAK